MREILFRGKNDRGEWIEGFYIKDYIGTYIYDKYRNTRMQSVLPETVGQYTGLTDKNGKKIFDGDIVKAQDDVFGSPFCDGLTGKIEYDEAAYFIVPKDIMDTQYLYNECAVYEVIGNIHDNPELLKGGAE